MIRTVFSIIAMIAVLGLAGCQTETVQSGSGPVIMGASPEMTPSPQQSPQQSPGSVAPAPASAKPSHANSEFEGLNAATDPCAAQLQDICGALLMAYAMNKTLPATLEELQPFANGVTLNFNCPASGKRYIYVPAGLKADKVQDTLVLYDDVAAHHGVRWGIVMSPPELNKAVTMYVIPLYDKLFSAYQSK